MEPVAVNAKQNIVDAVMPIDTVPADFPVGFCLLTAGECQFVAYFDAAHQMTVASRRLTEQVWRYTKLPTYVGVDSHNYVTIAVDDAGYLHVSGNMHAVPLIYFRGTRPWDAGSLTAVDGMVGRDELRCTYPTFMRGPQGELIFHYRAGGSGDGDEIYNVYDAATRRWTRLLEVPLTDGQGLMNAYMNGPVLGPDGYYHLCWVWRDTPDCATNHDLSYARSRDLRHWETRGGAAVALPLSLKTAGVIVDPIPAGGGIINGCQQMGFDADGQVVITYHKFDAKRNTQAYAARFEAGRWQIRQLSDWAYRWEFRGTGSMKTEISLSKPVAAGVGKLALPYRHITHGEGRMLFDARTLAPLGTEPMPPGYPAHLTAPVSPFPEMRVRWAGDSGTTPEPGVRYVLRWEALPPNNDKPRTGKQPEPSRLVLYRLRTQ